MRYVRARYEEQQRELAYRIFVTDSLQNIPQNKYLTVRYKDLIYPKKEDTRTGDEVALQVITKLGLTFAGGE